MLMAVSVTTAYAQKNDPPSQQFGVGIYGITNFLPSGFEVTDAIDSTLQVGTELSLSVSNSSTAYLVAPFARLLYPWIVSPFVQGGIQLYSPTTGTEIGIFVGGGVAFCINHQINLHGDVDIINLFFSPSTVGWGVLRIGADYFFKIPR